jgi:hypothetical protein
MSDTSPHEEAQLLARVTVLELVLGMMIRDSMLKSGKGPQDILGFGEIVKTLFEGRTPTGAADRHLRDAADRFFAGIAADVGSLDTQ